jgi:hypothetical protein
VNWEVVLINYTLLPTSPAIEFKAVAMGIMAWKAVKQIIIKH